MGGVNFTVHDSIEPDSLAYLILMKSSSNSINFAEWGAAFILL